MATVVASTLNIIGCGRAGRVLGSLWHLNDVFNIGGVLNQSLSSAQDAVAQMGAGCAVSSIADMPATKFWMVATPDHTISEVCTELAKSPFNQKTSIIFHLSGSLESAILSEAGLLMRAASVHPLRSFANFDGSKADFAGTWCGFEGDAALRQSLGNAFEQIGGRVFDIPAGRKLLYHAASVMVSNYMNALMESGLKLYELAGIDRKTANQLITPIASSTLRNINADGPSQALTGPILRGDWRVIEAELDALDKSSPELANLYRELGRITLSMVEALGVLTETQLVKLKQVLD